MKRCIQKQLVSLIGITSLFASIPSQAEIKPEQQQRITYLVQHDCGSCHGMTLKGGLGPALTAQALKHKPVKLLSEIILYGIVDTPMPPWKDFLNEQEVTWLVEQLKSGSISEN